MGKGGEQSVSNSKNLNDSVKPQRLITAEELSLHRTPENGI